VSDALTPAMHFGLVEAIFYFSGENKPPTFRTFNGRVSAFLLNHFYLSSCEIMQRMICKQRTNKRDFAKQLILLGKNGAAEVI
jgi:hypothetical protein